MAIVIHQGDGVLGRWTLTEWRPGHLSGLVESIWHFEGTSPHPRELHFPNGLFELVVQLGDRFHFVKDGLRETCAPTCLTGLQTGPMIIEAPPRRSSVLGMRFHPAGAYAVLGSPLCEASERIVDLDDLLGRTASELAERCDDAPSAAVRVRCAARWIGERIARSPRIDPWIAWAAGRIERSHGLVAIARLQNETGFSKKRLIEAFREQIGLSPKLYARIVRFRRALTALHAGAGSLAQVALAAGYYDQPHMNRDFRELGGLAPGDFLAAVRYSPTTAVGALPQGTDEQLASNPADAARSIAEGAEDAKTIQSQRSRRSGDR